MIGKVIKIGNLLAISFDEKHLKDSGIKIGDNVSVRVDNISKMITIARQEERNDQN